jgi:cytoskeletal protein CcmA (bactofilin family)
VSIADVSGAWRGTAGIGAREASVVLNLRQDGTSVSGEFEVGGRPDISGDLAGMVSGTSVRFRLVSGYGSTGELQVAGDQITGIVSGEQVVLRRVK